MTTIDELVALPFVEETFSPAYLVGYYYTHLPEDWMTNIINWQSEKVEKTERVKIRTVAAHNFDYRRFAALRIVFFDDVPFLVIRNGGDDFSDHYVVNAEIYNRFFSFLSTFRKDFDPVVVPLPEGRNLWRFYGDHAITPGVATRSDRK